MAYEWEQDEWRTEVRRMSPLERQVNCGHTHRSTRTGICQDCGHEPDV